MDKSSKNLVAVSRGTLADAATAVKEPRTFNALRAAYQQQGIESAGFEFWHDGCRKWMPLPDVKTPDEAKAVIRKRGLLVRQVFHAQVLLEPNEREPINTRTVRKVWLE